MIIEEITVTVFQQHARVFGCERTKRAICVDPGGEAEHIVAALERRNFELQAIALTHAHMDHIGAVSALKKLRPNAQVILHPLDEPLYRQLPQQPLWLGIPQSQWTALGFDYEDPPPIERYWSDGETYVVGDLSFEVLHCPGHTPGHIALFESEKRVVVAGDCLFAGSIGRTDLPGGSYTDLMQSLIERIMPLGDDVIVYPGHGETTTIGSEKLNNAFLAESFLEQD